MRTSYILVLDIVSLLGVNSSTNLLDLWTFLTLVSRDTLFLSSIVDCASHKVRA